jgi:hypothetical protein
MEKLFGLYLIHRNKEEKPIDWSRYFEVCKEIDSLKQEVNP